MGRVCSGPAIANLGLSLLGYYGPISRYVHPYPSGPCSSCCQVCSDVAFSWQVSKNAAVGFVTASAAAHSLQRSWMRTIITANHPLPAKVSKGLLETTGLLSAETLIRSSSLIRERNVGKWVGLKELHKKMHSESIQDKLAPRVNRDWFVWLSGSIT